VMPFVEGSAASMPDLRRRRRSGWWAGVEKNAEAWGSWKRAFWDSGVVKEAGQLLCVGRW